MAGGRGQGQSTVELVLVMPFFVLMLLTVVQVGLLVHTRLMVTHAAREAAREAAVGSAYGEIRSAAVESSGLDASRLYLDVAHSGNRVTAAIGYTSPTDVPLVGLLVGEAVFSARATMRLE